MPTYSPHGEECPNCKRLREHLQWYLGPCKRHDLTLIGMSCKDDPSGGWCSACYAAKALENIQPPQQDSKFWCDCHDERIWTDNPNVHFESGRIQRSIFQPCGNRL